jgi:hypothetical protein
MLPPIPTNTQLLFARELARMQDIPDERRRSPSDHHEAMPDPLWIAIRQAFSRLTATIRREPAA